MMSSLMLALLASALLNGILPTHSQECNYDGIVQVGEECDNGNNTDDVTCVDCYLAVQLDLNFTRSPSEFFELDEVIFFVEPTGLSLTLSPFRNLTRIFLVMLQDPPPIDDEIDIYTTEAFESGRVNEDFSPYFNRIRLLPGDTRLAVYNINTSLVTQGMVVTGSTDSGLFGGDGDIELTLDEALIVILSAGYRAREHPGFNPRQLCIVVDDSITNDISCFSLVFIGYNDDPPAITYSPVGVASFTEDQEDSLSIINGTISISDPDHPRYLQMSATARIIGHTSGSLEFISVSSFNPDFAYNYNISTGTLFISGAGTPEIYEILLGNLTYFNNMTEPFGTSRDIELMMFDGNFTSNSATVQVIIVNINDPPEISLDGADPVINTLSANYTEGSGSLEIVPNLVILDPDPSPMIQRFTLRISNPQDGNQEMLDYPTNDSMGLVVTSTPHELSFTGISSLDTYNSVVTMVTYEHLDAFPGNPSTNEIRMIDFYIEDDSGASSLQNSILQLSILPVNDPPILFFISDSSNDPFSSGDSGVVSTEPPLLLLSGDVTATFQYTEDDPPVNFGRDIYLRDVDSNIESATLWLTNLLNGENDDVYVSDGLLTTYNVAMTTEDNDLDLSRVIRLTGVAPPEAYEDILKSLSYRNLHLTNRVSDGRREVTIATNDTGRLSSSQITAIVVVGDRNDPPAVDLGAGVNADLNITFPENGASIPIILPHLVSVMDEEGHNISRLTVELIPAAGADGASVPLDPTDAIFLRSPLARQFIDDFMTPPTTRSLDIILNATTATYTDALLSIYYDNAEDEPTLFTREVLVTLYDDNFLRAGISTNQSSNLDDELGVSRITLRVRITIAPINDNAPRILIRAEPDGCGLSSTTTAEGGSMTRRRRDVKAAASKIRKRTLEYKPDDTKSPGINSVYAHFNSLCLRTINITFNIETSAPIVEIPTKLKNILSFDAPELNSAQKFGTWLDRATLLVVFDECLEWRSRADNNNDRERQVFIYFEAERGGCNWESACTDNNAICFRNNTGCPISGAYPISMNGSSSEEDPCQQRRRVGGKCGDGGTVDPADDSTISQRHSLTFFILLVVVIVTVFLSLLYLCTKNFSRIPRRTPPETPKIDIESTSIQMTSDPTLLTKNTSGGIQEVAVTISPPPPYKQEVGVVKHVATKGADNRSKSPRDRRRMKRKKETRGKIETESDGDHNFLLASDHEGDGSDDGHGGVATLSSGRSCDPAASPSNDDAQSPRASSGGGAGSHCCQKTSWQISREQSFDIKMSSGVRQISTPSPTTTTGARLTSH